MKEKTKNFCLYLVVPILLAVLVTTGYNYVSVQKDTFVRWLVKDYLEKRDITKLDVDTLQAVAASCLINLENKEGVLKEVYMLAQEYDYKWAVVDEAVKSSSSSKNNISTK